MTTYRTPAEVLARSVQSVLDQTLRDLELILVLDERPGELPEDVLESFSGDSRLRLVAPGHVGRGRALNLGLQAANAPLVAIQDADDESQAERLDRQARVFEQRRDLWLLGTEVNTTHSFDEHATWPVSGEASHVVILDRELLHSNPIVHSSVMARRERLDQVGGYSVGRRRHFDYDLYLRMRQAGGVFAVLQEPLVLKRIHHDQAFESDAAVVERAWSAFRLQLTHARAEPGLRQLGYIGVASVRQLGHVLRTRRS